MELMLGGVIRVSPLRLNGAIKNAWSLLLCMLSIVRNCKIIYQHGQQMLFHFIMRKRYMRGKEVKKAKNVCVI